MRLLNIHGRLVSKNISRYTINWESACRSKIQFSVKQFLKPYWRNHFVYEEVPVFGTLLKVDIINFSRMIAVEIQGQQHTSFNKHFHNNSRETYRRSIIRDVKKEKWLEINNIKLVEVHWNEVEDLSASFFKEKYNIVL